MPIKQESAESVNFWGAKFKLIKIKDEPLPPEYLLFSSPESNPNIQYINSGKSKKDLEKSLSKEYNKMQKITNVYALLGAFTFITGASLIASTADLRQIGTGGILLGLSFTYFNIYDKYLKKNSLNEDKIKFLQKSFIANED